MRQEIVIGATFPDYQLEDQAGVLRRLSELQGGNPMVLHLSVICTDSPLNLNEFRDSLGAPWLFLGDFERTVQQDLDIEEFTNPHNP